MRDRLVEKLKKHDEKALSKIIEQQSGFVASVIYNTSKGSLTKEDIDYVGAKARMYLQNHFQEWVFRYHHRLPYMYFDLKKLQNLEFKHHKAVIDCAIANAYIFCREYTIVLFDSELGNEELPDNYKNLRK